MNIGYCCINLSNPKLKVSRGMIQKTFLTKGLPYCSELAIQNIDDLEKIIDWNYQNGISLYRMSSYIFPWMSEYLFDELPNFNIIKDKLAKVGAKIKNYKMRCGFHPGPFNVINSENPITVDKTVYELTQFAEILDMMELDQSPFYYINVHINNAKPNKQEALSRFLTNLDKLPKNVISRLTIENDDKKNLYTIKEVIETLAKYKSHSIPAVFDNLHHVLNSNGECIEDMVAITKATWPEGIRPLMHWSSSRKKWEDPESIQTSHADYIYDKIPDCYVGTDIEMEAKAKDLALIKYKKDYL